MPIKPCQRNANQHPGSVDAIDATVFLSVVSHHITTSPLRIHRSWASNACSFARYVSDDPHFFWIYLLRCQKTLTLVSNHDSIKLVQTLGTTDIGTETHLILTRFDTKESVF